MTGARALVGGLIVVAVVLTLDPLRVALPGDGLDPSWGLAIERAAVDSWQWGRDIVFTFGPYGYHYQRLFHPDLVVEILAVSTMRCVLTGIGVALLMRDAHPLQAGLAVAAVLISLPVTDDNAYLLLPLLAVLVHLRDRPAAPLWYLLAVAAFCGLAVLIKTTFAVLALALLALVDLDRMLRRRPPLLVPVCLSVALAAYLAAGQELANLPAFIRLSLDVAAGFSHAMGLFGPLRVVELTAFLAASAVILVLIVMIERRCARLTTRAGVLGLAALAVFWFITYKAGFTRHDLHTMISWTSLGVAAALYAASTDAGAASRIRRLLLIVGVATALLAPIRLAVAPGFGIDGVILQTLVYNPGHTLRTAGALLSGPSAWMAAQEARRAEAIAAIRDRNPLPPGAGTVDTVPSIQAAAIAAGLVYRPRPMIQEYSTYTTGLIAANRAAFAGDGAPDTLLLAPGSIDGRYPTLAEGPLWPLFLTRYEPAGTAGPVTHLDQRIEVLVLRRRERAAAPQIVPMQTLTAAPGQEFTVPDLASPVFATMDIRLSPAGRVLALLHQAPAVGITVTLADGSQHIHRLIPAIAREGFLLSPYIADTAALEVLYGGPPEATARVTTLRIDVPGPVGWAFTDDIAVTFAAIR